MDNKLEEMLLKKIELLSLQIDNMKNCQNCKHYSAFDGKLECKDCYAKNNKNWELK